MAESARDSGPSADELLDMWNRDYSADAPSALAPEQFSTDAGDSEYDLRSYATPRYTRPDGRSLTPNIDRVLEKSSGSSPAVNCNPFPPRHRRRNPPGGPPSCEPPRCPGGGGHGGHGGHGGGNGGGCEPVPEPGTMLLFGAAAGVAGLRKRFGRGKKA